MAHSQDWGESDSQKVDPSALANGWASGISCPFAPDSDLLGLVFLVFVKDTLAQERLAFAVETKFRPSHPATPCQPWWFPDAQPVCVIEQRQPVPSDSESPCTAGASQPPPLPSCKCPLTWPWPFQDRNGHRSSNWYRSCDNRSPHWDWQKTQDMGFSSV